MSEIDIPEFAWKTVSKFEIPNNSYVCGYSSNGSVIYVGLVEYRGCLYPAKVFPSRREARITVGGIEKSLSTWCKLLVVTSR
ncbi:hypothetical protein HHI36_005073 [Cryptolaemus montrouzieri]|uniref:Uncharacterized protein n=1 Tax=Cryptolaemus montrouzieri TaxID=559131 RepID=A0ABD2NT30_9CUCU